jgi:hypothetical protein
MEQRVPESTSDKLASELEIPLPVELYIDLLGVPPASLNPSAERLIDLFVSRNIVEGLP